MPLGDIISNNYDRTGFDPITIFYNKLKRYPGNNKQWWVTKATADDKDKGIKEGDFLPQNLDKYFAGNNRAPKGHFVLNAFYKDRTAVSGVLNIPKEIVKDRPSSVAFYSGRAWYGCLSTVYFSQVLTDKSKAGNCYQEADPTSEDISGLIATDGGEIPIPEAQLINKLVPDGDGVLVFAKNGVWAITGTSNGFTAEDYSVNKVSHIGCDAPASVIATEAGVFWWSEVGILGLSQKFGAYGPVLGVFDSSNITETTIQEFYNNIEVDARRDCKVVHDNKANRIIWLYRDADVQANQYNRALILDVALKAFFPWKFESFEDNTAYYIKGAFRGERISFSTNATSVVAGTVQVVSNGVNVEVNVNEVVGTPNSIEYFAMNNSSQGRICQVNSTKFVDWYSINNQGVPYNSFVETGYNLFEDGMRKKRITYIMPYLRRTETEWNEVGQTQTLDNPSSCWLTVKWDWANSTVSNKWSTPVQVYRNVRFQPMPIDGTYDTGFPMVITKNKVRGNGRAIQFRFGTDEPGRDFDIYGWSMAITGSTVP